MRTLRALLSVVLVLVVAACGGPGTNFPPPTGGVTISVPAANAEVVTGSIFRVEGTAPLASEVSVSIGGGAPVGVNYRAPEDDRLPWYAWVTAGAVGTDTIQVTATNDDGSSQASVQVRVVDIRPYGAWAGVFHIDRRPTGGVMEDGGTMMVWYNSRWFRMYFARAGVDVEGTTDGWDLIDSAGLRITGTYHPAGSTRPSGLVSETAWVSYRVVLETGEIIEAELDQDF